MDSLSLKNLTNALSEVDSWQQLGVQLDINYHKLKELERLPTIEDRKLAMLQCWLDIDLRASWEKLVCALKSMGLNRVAQQIQRRYHVPLSNQADITQVPILSEHAARLSPSSPMQVSTEKKGEVQHEIDTLKSLYDDLLMETVESFKEKHAQTPTFLSTLRTSIAILPSSLKDEHVHFLQEKSSEIAKATSVDELFIVVSCYSDFLNCSLVVHVISRFGDDKLRQDLQNYRAKLEAFRSHTTLWDFVAAYGGIQEIPPHFSRLVMKMGPQWELRTLSDLEQLHETMKAKSFLSSYAVRLMGGGTGSILLMWSIPRACSGFLISLLDLHFLRQYNIEGVTIDGEDLKDYRSKHHFPDVNVVSSKNTNEFSERLLWASGEGCLDDVVFLLNSGVEVNSKGQWEERTALMLASEGGHLDVVKTLLRAQADVDAQDTWEEKTALMLASENGHLDVVRELLTAEANVNTKDKWQESTALMLASEEGHLDVVRELLGAQADINTQDEDGWTALMLASSSGNSDTVRNLLSAGAQVDLQDEDGWTALMLASFNNCSDAVRVLLSAGAQVNLQSEDGWTALILASSSHSSDTIRILLSAGAQVDLQNKDGLSALINAVCCGHTETVKVLVEAGADVNLQEKTSGRSAVLYGAEKGDLQIVKLLIQSGANLSLKDKDGCTALTLASSCGHSDTVSVLLSAGAAGLKSNA